MRGESRNNFAIDRRQLNVKSRWKINNFSF